MQIPGTDDQNLQMTWRQQIFEQAAQELSDSTMPRLQKLLGLWHWANTLPYPRREDITLLASLGTMHFTIPVLNQHLFFSVFYFLGELRIGVRIPAILLHLHDSIGASVRCCYDGNVATRETATDSGTFYDWIWKDSGLASIDLMTRSLRDPAIRGQIADGLAKSLMHLYMSVMNILISQGQLVALNGAVTTQESMQHFMLHLRALDGDFRTIVNANLCFDEIGIAVLQHHPQSADRSLVMVAVAPQTTREDMLARIDTLALPNLTIDVLEVPETIFAN